MTQDELKYRFKTFALAIIKLVDSMPKTIAGWAIAKQIIRSGTSPSANYRAACLAKSDKDFLNKLKMVEEEMDETLHWLELTRDSNLLPATTINPLINEGSQLFSIIVASIKTTKAKLDKVVD